MTAAEHGRLLEWFDNLSVGINELDGHHKEMANPRSLSSQSCWAPWDAQSTAYPSAMLGESCVCND